MEQEEIRNLVERYLHDIATKEEKDRLFAWYQSESSKDVEWDLDDFEDEHLLKTRLYAKIMKHNEPVVRTTGKRLFYRIAAAAAILVFLSGGLLFYYRMVSGPDNASKELHVKTKSNDILPGGPKAILTLSDGRKIVLDDAKNGTLISQAGVKVHKNSNGIVEYTLVNHQAEEAEKVHDVYNTIQTPVGGRYQLNLADGSKVWLNSASSLRFPVFFTADTREVELKGEAYFEVSKDKKRKFTVRSGNQSVEVLGTRFNIKAYPDEPLINTTLIEGSIRVIQLTTKNSELLSPGDQSELGESIKVKRINAQAEVAWKDGYFNFKNADIETVMRQLGRWYGISARYEGTLSKQHFSGAIANNLTLLEVLEILERSDIHFRIEGKEVIVMP